MKDLEITQEQFNKIFDYICQIQDICEEADLSSINIWLTSVKIKEEKNNIKG